MKKVTPNPMGNDQEFAAYIKQLRRRQRVVFFLIVSLFAIAIFASCTSSKQLSKGWYTYKQITRAGYQCEPFKGRQYIRPTNDSAWANIVPKN